MITPIVFPALLALASLGLQKDLEDPVELAIEKAREKAQSELEAAKRPRISRTSWENGWTLTSDHYVVRSNRSRLFTHVAGKALDQMWDRYEAFLGIKPEGPTYFPVDVYPDLATYNDIGNQASSDLDAHHSSSYGSFYFSSNRARPVVSYYAGYDALTLQWLSHAAFHQFYANANQRALPTWLLEGLASYYALHHDFDRSFAAYKLVDARGVFVSISDLMQVPLSQFTNETYLQLGMFVYFLNDLYAETRITYDNEGNVTGGAFRDYVRSLSRGVADQDNPTHSLLTSKRDLLEQELRKQFKL